MTNHPPYNYPDIGNAGEDLVAHWLQSQSWVILSRRWRCRWGEIDIIAQDKSTLAFVEVKTRNPRNWDAGGKNAIALPKQIKLWRAAQMFLVEHPQRADYPCRFDVAIVSYQQISQTFPTVKVIEKNSATSLIAGYKLTLQEYIIAAFESVNDFG